MRRPELATGVAVAYVIRRMAASAPDAQGQIVAIGRLGPEWT